MLYSSDDLVVFLHLLDLSLDFWLVIVNVLVDLLVVSQILLDKMQLSLSVGL